MDIQIVSMEQHHVDLVYEIECSCFPDDPWPKEWLTEEFEGSINFHWVAYADNIMAGYACLYLNDDYMKVGNMMVASRLRRHGIGRALMKKAIGLAKENGAGSIKPEVAVSNAAARALYRADLP